jgi:hypothetical protein
MNLFFPVMVQFLCVAGELARRIRGKYGAQARRLHEYKPPRGSP